jgi:hypothetical protein
MFVTTYGSNATAITRYSTIYGDINTVNVSSISAAQSIYTNTFLHAVGQYIGGGSIFLARGTDGSIGSATSYGWPTPYILLSAIASSTTVSYSGCPSGLQEVTTNVLAGQSCGCALVDEYFGRTRYPLSGVSSTEVPLPSNFYVPISSIDFNMSQLNSGPFNQFVALNVIDLKSWLLKQPWASTLFPNLERCTMIGEPQGPPGVKIPVHALTTTITTITQAVSSPTSVSLKPSSSHALPGSNPNSIPTSTLSPSSSSSSSSSSSKIPYSEGSSNVPSETSLSQYDSTVINGDSSTTISSDEHTAVTTAITVSGTTMSLSTSGLVLGSSTIHLPTQALSPTASVLGIYTFTANTAAIAIGGTTLTEGASAATISGTVISLGSSELIVDSSTFTLPTSLPSSLLTINRVTFTIKPTGVQISDSTLSADGSAITIDGLRISLGTADIAIGTSTIPYDSAASSLQTAQSIGSAIMAGFDTPNTTTEALSSTTTTATTSPPANGTIPGETVFPPVYLGGAAKLSSDSWLVAFVVLGMTFMGFLGG